MRASRLGVGRGMLVALSLSLSFALALTLLAGGPTRAAAETRASSLPPATRTALVAIFDTKVKPFGLRVTRAALVNSAQVRTAKGTHLAIYVEPLGEYTPSDYLAGTLVVSKVFLPYVFTRWKGLRSFDVCQEPTPSVDDGPAPPPETQVYATRAGSSLVDWKTVDVATMIQTSRREAAAAGTQRQVRFSLFVARHLEDTPEYRQVAGTAATTSPVTPAGPDYG